MKEKEGVARIKRLTFYYSSLVTTMSLTCSILHMAGRDIGYLSRCGAGRCSQRVSNIDGLDLLIIFPFIQDQSLSKGAGAADCDEKRRM